MTIAPIKYIICLRLFISHHKAWGTCINEADTQKVTFEGVILRRRFPQQFELLKLCTWRETVWMSCARAVIALFSISRGSNKVLRALFCFESPVTALVVENMATKTLRALFWVAVGDAHVSGEEVGEKKQKTQKYGINETYGPRPSCN